MSALLRDDQAFNLCLLLSFNPSRWRHDAEMQHGEMGLFSLLTGHPVDWLPTDTQPRTKTRWQEAAESLFADLLSMRPFDSTNTQQLASLRLLAGICDDGQMQRIIVFYLSTLEANYPRNESEFAELLERERCAFQYLLLRLAGDSVISPAQ